MSGCLGDVASRMRPGQYHVGCCRAYSCTRRMQGRSAHDTMRYAHRFEGRKVMGFGKVQARGQVTIPTEVRQAANIRAGDTLLFEVKGQGRLDAVVIPTHSSLDDLFDRFSWPGEFNAERVWAEVDHDLARDLPGPDADLSAAEAAAAKATVNSHYRRPSGPSKTARKKPARASTRL